MSVPNPIIVPMTVSDNHMVVPLAVSSDSEQVSLDVGMVLVTGMPEHYTGPFTFTPGDTAQTISIRDKMSEEDIIIDAIPSNYGKISWNGSVLTVS